MKGFNNSARQSLGLSSGKWLGALLVGSSLVLQGCDDLTQREEDVAITLDTFNLIGTDSGSIGARATVTGNPACTSSQINLNSLLAQVDNFDEIDEYLETLDVNAVRYRITQNSTPVEATGSMQMTDPATGNLVAIASVAVPANQTVDDWTALPFIGDGANILNHYLDNRDANFLYCAEGSPNSADLSMTIQLQLDLLVTVDLL